MEKQKMRCGKIDFLRFIFSICIVLNHAKYIMPTKALARQFAGFSFGVEFFFLVSGYLMMATIERAEAGSTVSLGKETGAFLWRKVKVLYPELLISYMVGFGVIAAASSLNLGTLFFKSWFEAFALISTGLTGLDEYTVVPVIWYVSSMLICMALLYPLTRRFKDKVINIVLPLVIVLVFGYMYRTYKTIRGPLSWTGVTMRGNLRALAELSLGMLCYGLTQKLKKVDFTKAGRIVLGALEIGLYAVVIGYMAMNKASVKDFLYLVALCAAVILTFSGKSIGHELFDNKICAWLGKYSVSLFCSHYVFCIQLEHLIPGFETLSWQLRLAAYMGVSFATGLGVMGLSALIRKVSPAVLTGARRLLTNPTAEDGGEGSV